MSAAAWWIQGPLCSLGPIVLLISPECVCRGVSLASWGAEQRSKEWLLSTSRRRAARARAMEQELAERPELTRELTPAWQEGGFAIRPANDRRRASQKA